MGLRDYQQQLKANIHRELDALPVGGAVLAVMPTGCHAKGTGILMWDGAIKPVESVVVGDRVCSPDGSYRTVLSLARGRQEMYRITPRRGPSFVVNGDHVLHLQRTNDGKTSLSQKIEHVTVREYLTKTKWWRHIRKLCRSQAYFKPRGEPAFDAYMCGVFLGDGTLNRTPGVATADPEIVAACRDLAKEYAAVLRIEDLPDNKANHYHFTQSPSLRRVLKDVDLWGQSLEQKHVPDAYKYGSLRTRLHTLAGLIDSDGYLSNGVYDFISKSPQLTGDVVFLARSVGLQATARECQKRCVNNGKWGTYFRACISGEVAKVPTRLARHQPAPRRQIKDPLVVGFSVEALPTDDYYGFQLDGDHLYLTDDFIIHHNSGKTVTFGDITDTFDGAVAIQVHRTELVCQISTTLARFGVRHRIVAPQTTISAALADHRREAGGVYYDPHSPHAVIAVDTLIARYDLYKQWASQVRLWITDEAAHVLRDNKWGKCVELFPNAKGIGFTATPKRADGKGLGRHAHGVFDTMVLGPTVAELIARGFLSRYRILSTPSDMNIEDLKATASGDFNQQKLAARAHQSHIVGDVVETYVRHAMGKQGITFTTDVETANEMAAQFNAAGVPAEAVSANTPAAERSRAIRRFRAGELKQLTNCDLFGEGFDVPGVEVVSLARPTMSLSLHLQQVGRAMRPAAGKDFALILDHVGNWKRHGLPDSPRRWSLDARERTGATKKDPDVIAVTSCLACFLVFPRAKLPDCPHCGHHHDPAARRKPEQVDGDLTELDPDVLAALRELVKLEDPDVLARRVMHAAGGAAADYQRGKHCERIRSQQALADAIALWAGHGNAAGKTDKELYREFFLTFGVDTLTALTLKRKEMDELRERVEKAYGYGR